MEYVIRPIAPRDAEGFNALRRMPGVFETTLGLPSERVQRNLDGINSLTRNDHQFVAVLPDDTVIGAAGLSVHESPRTRHTGDIGIFIHADYQNRGVGTALMETLLDLADNWLMLVRVQLEVYADNERAIHLYEKLGFETEGRKRMANIRHGAYVDELMMARLRLPKTV